MAVSELYRALPLSLKYVNSWQLDRPRATLDAAAYRRRSNRSAVTWQPS